MYYLIKTFGCQMNFSDSERIRTYLEKSGFIPINDSKEELSKESLSNLDLAIFTTCGIRQTAEDRVYGQVHNLRKKSPDTIIVVTGCLANRKDVQRKLKGKADLFIPIQDIQKLTHRLQEQFPDKFKEVPTEERKSYKEHYLEIPATYKKPESILIPIMTGCNNFCSYCVVPDARGREWSRPIAEIIREIAKAELGETKTVLLLGQNVNSYDYKGVNFPELLDGLVLSFPDITFSFLTSHPKDFSDKLIETIAKHSNVSRLLHLPLQSGSNKILKAMNRKYDQNHYLEIISKIRTAVPDVKISTDIIVGFPGETEREFQKTVAVFEQAKFSEAFINKYSPRPGTAAEKLGDPVPWEEKKRREKVLRAMLG